MYWATTTFRVTGWTDELNAALTAWREHVGDNHRGVKGIRCYRFNGGTAIVWQEAFDDFHDYQALIDEENDACAAIQAPVFRHMVPGSRESAIWAEVL